MKLDDAEGSRRAGRHGAAVDGGFVATPPPPPPSSPIAFAPLWNSAWNATAIDGHARDRPPCPGGLRGKDASTARIHGTPDESWAEELAGFGIMANTPHGGNGGYNGDKVATLHYDFSMTGLVPYYAGTVPMVTHSSLCLCCIQIIIGCTHTSTSIASGCLSLPFKLSLSLLQAHLYVVHNA